MARPRNYTRANAQIGMQLLNGADLIKQLEALEFQVSENVAAKAISAAMNPIENAMKANTPESQGSREKQSAKTKTKWAGSRKLKTTIRSVVRRRKRAGIAAGVLGLVGPGYSEGGGHGNLFAKDHKRKVLWGKDSGSIRTVNQFVKRSADETSAQARAILTQSVKAGIEQAARATNG